MNIKKLNLTDIKLLAKQNNIDYVAHLIDKYNANYTIIANTDDDVIISISATNFERIKKIYDICKNGNSFILPHCDDKADYEYNFTNNINDLNSYYIYLYDFDINYSNTKEQKLECISKAKTGVYLYTKRNGDLAIYNVSDIIVFAYRVCWNILSMRLNNLINICENLEKIYN